MQVEIRGLERLSYRERQVVMLKETGHSLEQIAKQLDMAPSSAATLLARAKGKKYEIVCIIAEDELGIKGDGWSDEDADT